MDYLLAVTLGYLLGCSHMAYYISRAKNVDMRRHGSGNLGTSNSVIVLGWPAAVAVGLHDIGKGLLAVVLAKLLFPQLEQVGALAGVACVVGHVFPFYLGFRGGKGFAAFMGVTLALNWQLALLMVVVIAAVTWFTDYLALGTFATIAIVPVWLGIQFGSLPLALILLAASALILWKHRENIVRIRNKTEIGFRSATKGEHKVT